MKRVFFSLILFFGLNCFAAFQYGMNIEKANDLVSAGSGKNAWSITAKQDVLLSFNKNTGLLSSVNNHMASVVNTLTSGAFTPSYSDLGYMVYDTASKTVLSSSSLNFVNDAATIRLNAGETIGFWIQSNGVTYSSVSGLSGYTYNRNTFGGGDSGNGKVYNFGTWYKENNMSYAYEQSLLVDVAPSGQPLPGVLATLLIGGGCIGAFSLRKKQNAGA